MSFTVVQPTAETLCSAYHQQKADWICRLRPDALGLILHLANISFQSRVLLVENTRGFMSGALAERSVNTILRVEFFPEMARQVPTGVQDSTVRSLVPNVSILD